MWGSQHVLSILAALAVATCTLLACNADRCSLYGCPSATPDSKSSCQDSGGINWSHFAGGVGADSGNGLSVTPACDVVMCGQFATSFDLAPGVPIGTADGDDVYLAMFSKDGEHRWHKAFGGTGPDTCIAVTNGPDSTIYATGSFESKVELNDTLTTNGRPDVFVAQFAADTGEPVWGRQFGTTSNNDAVFDIAVGAAGLVAVGGRFLEPGSENGPGGSVVALNSDGTQAWSRTFGSNVWVSEVHAVAFDDSNDLLVAGVSWSDGWTLDDDCAFQQSTPAANPANLFLAKLDGTTGRCLWISSVGADSSVRAEGIWPKKIRVTADGRIFVAGELDAPLLQPQPFEQLGEFAGAHDVFVAGFFEDDGKGFVDRFRIVGSNREDHLASLHVGEQEIVIAGDFSNALVTGGPDYLTIAQRNVFLVGYDHDLNWLFHEQRGGSDGGLDVAAQDMVTLGKSFLIRGEFANTWTDPGGTTTPSNGDTDMFTISVTPPPRE